MQVSAGGVLDHGNKLEATVDILWATWLCYTRIQELTMAKFRQHHVVLISLNIHLFEHCVPLTVHKKVVKRVEVLEKALVSATSTINSLVSKVEAVARKQK